MNNEKLLNSIIKGDCLEVMNEIENKSIDMVLCDLPYGVTAAEWDEIINLQDLWKHYKRIIKDHGAIVLTATQPFASKLIMSHLKGFKHEWIWNKKRPSGFQLAKYKPMQKHELILVFTGKGEKVNYYPIMKERKKAIKGKVSSKSNSSPLKYTDGKERTYTHYYPQSILSYNKPNHAIHPTQKPIDLLEYLILTYTKEGETVLDNCIGSGSTAIACLNTSRNFIGIEKNEDYYNLANERIKKEKSQLKLFY